VLRPPARDFVLLANTRASSANQIFILSLSTAFSRAMASRRAGKLQNHRSRPRLAHGDAVGPCPDCAASRSHRPQPPQCGQHRRSSCRVQSRRPRAACDHVVAQDDHENRLPSQRQASAMIVARSEKQADILCNYPGLAHDDLAACLAYAGDVLRSEKAYSSAA